MKYLDCFLSHESSDAEAEAAGNTKFAEAGSGRGSNFRFFVEAGSGCGSTFETLLPLPALPGVMFISNVAHFVSL